MASDDIKSFYRQKKGSGKASSDGTNDSAQTPALVAHGSFNIEDGYEEERLRQFNMDMSTGRVTGLYTVVEVGTRVVHGANPPADVVDLLGRHKASVECLWEGRV